MSSGFQGIPGKLDRAGGDGGAGTPVPIPNTEVKRPSGRRSRKARQARCRPGPLACGSMLFLLFGELNLLA